MYIITTGLNPNEPDILCHHGIKGQKWGVRRFQDRNGRLTSEGKQHEMYRRNVKRNLGTTKAVNSIVRSLSEEEKHKLGQYDKGNWINTKHEYETLANKGKTFVKYINDKPAGFLEIWTNGEREGQVAIATHKNYRGQGVSTELVNNAKKWVNQYGYKMMDQLDWWVREDNAASIHLAEKNGFKFDKTEPDPYGNTYRKYVMDTRKRKKA